MSEETFGFVCTSCARSKKTVEAVKYCIECSGYRCQPCVDIHSVFPTLTTHTISDITHSTTASGVKSILTLFPEQCSEHKNKVLDMYCEHHGTVGCSMCFSKHHKFCHDSHIHSIPDMTDIMFKLSDSTQARQLLKDIIATMNNFSKSKESQLEALNMAKKDVLDKVTTFQEALEAIVRKAAESSRQEVLTVCKELENDIKQDKHAADKIADDLKTADDELNQFEGNRSQIMMCTKLGQELIKKAEGEKIRQELQHNLNEGMHITFVPDQALLEYMKALQVVGRVQKREQQKQSLYLQLKNDLYGIKQNRDINIKLSGDSKTCRSFGCCITHDEELLLTDGANKKLKRIDIQTMTIVDYCTLDYAPRGVCCISKHEVAVACYSDNKIQFVSIQDKMSPTRQLTMSHRCYGIAHNDGKLYVSDSWNSVYVYNMTGSRLKTISRDHAGKCLFAPSRHITINGNGNVMLVGGWENGLICFDGLGHYVSSVKDTDIDCADGVAVDDRGNVFVVGNDSQNVVQFSENGKKVGVVVKQGDGLQKPYAVCFHQGLNEMFVTMADSDVVKMYELE